MTKRQKDGINSNKNRIKKPRNNQNELKKIKISYECIWKPIILI